MTDPSYGGALTYEDNSKWRLTIHVDFDEETTMPTEMVTVDKVSYRICKASPQSTDLLPSPDKLMTLVPTDATFKEETYLVIVEGYNGWTRAPNDLKQYFLQAGPQAGTATLNGLGTFSLRFDGLEAGWDETNLRLYHLPGYNSPGTSPAFVGSVVAGPGDHAVEVHGLTTLGYYGLMKV